MADSEEIRPSLLDPAVLRRLLQQLSATDVDELEITSGTSRIYLRRDPTLQGGASVEVVAGGQRDGTPIRAPLTGVYYARPSPEQAAFVEVGDVVETGQTVALIETMKLFNEVIADVSGEVLALAADDGDLVEAGQPLLYVRA